MSSIMDNFNFEAEYEKIKEKVKKPNILLCGATGVGKSSVVNHLFGGGLAQVGEGEPVTRGIHRYEQADKSVVLFDSEGYEIGNEANSHYHENIIGFIDIQAAENNPETQVHLCWYCISAANKRFTDMDQAVINQVRARNVPVAILYTQIDSVDGDELGALTAETERRCPGVPRFNTCCLPDAQVQRALAPWLQWEALMDWSIASLDEALQAGFAAALQGGLRQKRDVAKKKIVPIYTAAAGTAGAVPIPFADSAVLVPIQTSMAMHVMATFGMDSLSGAAKQLVGNMLVSQLGRMVASTLTTNLVKLIPAVGQAVGSAVNAAVASAFTLAIGLTVCELCYRYCYEVQINGRDLSILEWFTAERFGEVYKLIANKQRHEEDSHA